MGNHRFVQPPMLLSVRGRVLGKLSEYIHLFSTVWIDARIAVRTSGGRSVFSVPHPNHTANKQGYFGTCITSPASGSTLRRLALIVRVKPLSDTALRA